MFEIYEILFLVGLALIVIAFVFGQLCDMTGIDGLDLSIGDFPLFVPFSPMLLFLFATILGGIGMLILRYLKWLPWWGSILVGSICGITVCRMIRRFILIPLKKAQSTSAASKEELVGLLATVNETIPSKGFGEITYIIHGNSYVAPAKAVSSVQIKKGASVTICWIEDYVFYVTQIDNI
ncbi:putative membrane protein [Lachnospiraceae bacterium KM106-2]|nr:putative membrane protein [Lachnospiraceae bacterium KM106-2]